MDPLFAVTGHRGAARLAPENTLLGLEEAFLSGATAVEVDVRRTRDRALVLMHDETTDRVTGVSGVVAEMTLDELARLRVGPGWVTTVEEALAFLKPRGMAVMTELKAPGVERGVLELLRAYGMLERAMVTSFHPSILAEVRRLNPTVRIGYIVEGEWRGEYLDTTKQLRAYAIIPNYGMVSEDVVDEVHGEGLRIITWTVNSGDVAARMLELGVDGIISDDPAMVRRVLEARGVEVPRPTCQHGSMA